MENITPVFHKVCKKSALEISKTTPLDFEYDFELEAREMAISVNLASSVTLDAKLLPNFPNVIT